MGVCLKGKYYEECIGTSRRDTQIEFSHAYPSHIEYRAHAYLPLELYTKLAGDLRANPEKYFPGSVIFRAPGVELQTFLEQGLKSSFASSSSPTLVMQEQLAEGLGSPTDSISDIAVHSPRQARSLLATGRANYLPAFTEKIYPMLEARLIKALAPLGFKDVMLAREALFGQKEQGGSFASGSPRGLANPLKATKSDQVEFLVAKAKREPAFLQKFKNPTAFQVSEAAAVDQATVVTDLHEFFSNLLEISEHLTFDTQQTIGFAYDEPILMFANAMGEDLPDATTDPRLYPPHAATWKVSGTDADPEYLLYSPVEIS